MLVPIVKIDMMSNIDLASMIVPMLTSLVQGAILLTIRMGLRSYSADHHNHSKLFFTKPSDPVTSIVLHSTQVFSYGAERLLRAPYAKSRFSFQPVARSSCSKVLVSFISTRGQRSPTSP